MEKRKFLSEGIDRSFQQPVITEKSSGTSITVSNVKAGNTLRLTVAHQGTYSLSVYTPAGRRIFTLGPRAFKRGTTQISLPSGQGTPGVHVVRVSDGSGKRSVVEETCLFCGG